MTLWEAIGEDRPLTARFRGDEYGRIMAYTFRHPKGIVFLDIYHQEGFGKNPVHVIEGELSGSGPWAIGDWTISEIEHGDPECRELNEWISFLDTRRGKRYGREIARAILEKDEVFSLAE